MTLAERTQLATAARASRTTEQKVLTVAKRRKPGSISPSLNKWLYQWIAEDGLRHRKRFDSEEEAKAFREGLFPTPIVPDAAASFVYELIAPCGADQQKRYIGETSQSLNERLARHQRWAKTHNSEFYEHMRKTDPTRWTIRALHTLYGVTTRQRRAAEALEIAKIPMENLWNTVMSGKCSARDDRWLATVEDAAEVAWRAIDHSAKLLHEAKRRKTTKLNHDSALPSRTPPDDGLFEWE